MSLIDDVVSKKFSRGSDFKRGKNTGTFGKEIKKAVIESPSLRSLKDNVDDMREVVDKFEEYASGDKITKDMAQEMLIEFKKNNPNATNQDIIAAKSIFKHLSKEGAPKNTATKPKAPTKAEKRVAEIKKKIKPAPVRELPEFLQNRGSISINKKNPWSLGPRGGLGGGISSGGNSSSGSFRKPTLLK